jgi:hypothetical protein
MAHPSGDGGRDSELFSPDAMPLIAAQYSVAADWKSKVRQTAKRISKECPNIRILVYMTNRMIGGQADDLKGELLKQGVSLDVRDRSWFLERAESDPQRENASLDLIDRIARPYLAGESIINKSGSTPFPRTVELRVSLPDAAIPVSAAVGDCDSVRCSRRYPLLLPLLSGSVADSPVPV